MKQTTGNKQPSDDAVQQCKAMAIKTGWPEVQLQEIKKVQPWPLAALWGWNIAHANDDRLLTLTMLCRGQPMDCLPMVSVGRQALLRFGKILGPCQALERIATDSR